MTKSATCNIADVTFGEEVLALRPAAVDAAQRRGAMTFGDYMNVAPYVASSKRDILRHLGIATPKGIRYSTLWKQWLHDSGLDWIGRSTLCNMLSCYRHRDECEALLDAQPESHSR